MIDGQLIGSWYIERLKTVSEANSTEHWRIKAKRHKLQKAKVRMALRTRPSDLKTITEHRDQISGNTLCKVRVFVTRIAPRALDSQDNLPVSLKYISDCIAEELTGDYRPGRADGVDWIEWQYSQEKGKVREYSVKIEIYKL